MPEEDEYQALCKAVGFVVVNWAIAEQALDGWVAITWHDHGGKDLLKRLPKHLEPKVDYLTECFSKLPSLHPQRDRALAILPRVTELSLTRHDLVHGAITSVTSKDGVFAFSRLSYEKRTHRVRETQFDLRKFEDLAVRLLDVGRDVAELGNELVGGRIERITAKLRAEGKFP